MAAARERDKSVPAHSLRLTDITEERLKYFCSLPNCVVVRHSADIAEREHLHIFIQHDKNTSRPTLLKRWAQVPCLADLHGQSNFSLKPSLGDVDAYWRYTMSGYKIGDGKFHSRNMYDEFAKDGATCLHYDISGRNQPEPYPARGVPEKIIINNNEVINNNNLIKSARKTPTTQEKQHKFYLYCEKYYKEFKDESITYVKIFKLLHAYASGGFNENCTSMYAEYAMYNLCKARDLTEQLEETQNQWVRRALNRLNRFS